MTGSTGDGSVVLVAYHYPPMVGAASERAASFARHLPELGWQMRVVSVEDGLFDRDVTNVPPPVPVIRTRAPELARLIPRPRASTTWGVAGAAPAPATARTLGALRRLVHDYVYVPDAQLLWIPSAVAAARAALAETKERAVVMTTSVPYSAHLAGLRIARRANAPWVAEFRDPWAHVASDVRARSRPRRRIDETLERRVVENADLIVVTSDRTRERLAQRYPQLDPRRFAVVRNGFEPAHDPAPRPPRPDEPLLLEHAGSVPAHVPIEPLLEGIAAVDRRQPGALVLRVHSSYGRWLAAAGGKSPPWLRLEGLVSPAAARAAVSGASVTVLLCPGAEYDEHVSAKLLEYLGARRPVLAALSPSGEMAALASAYGDVRLLPEYTSEQVEAGIERLLSEQRRGQLSEPVEPAQPLDELSRRWQAMRLSELLSALI